jgi:hypothetical protein
MTVESNKEAVRRFTEALDRNDLTALPEICTPSCAEAWSQGINSDPWADHHVTLKQLIAEGDFVVTVVETRAAWSATFTVCRDRANRSQIEER